MISLDILCGSQKLLKCTPAEAPIIQRIGGAELHYQTRRD